MSRSAAARLVIPVAAALLFGYLLVWSQVSSLDIGRSDFTSTYMGAVLLRDGHRAQLYDESVQAPLHAQIIAPDTEGNLPFVDAPVAAALAVPVSFLDLHTAYRVWSIVQLLLLALAVVIAARAAPWRIGTRTSTKVAVALAALAGAATLVELLQAQWGSVTALAVALAYREWRRRHDGWGAAWIVVGAGIAKPHLAIGLLALLVGWRARRIVIGAASAAVVMVLANIAVAGPAGLVQFVRLALSSNTRWQLRTFTSAVGIPGTFLGNSAAAQMIGIAGSLAAIAVAVWCGMRLRARRASLEHALAAATALSLLASPHAGLHDVVILAPAAVWSFAALPADTRLRAAPIALWCLLSLAVVIGIARGGELPPGQLVPWAVIACVAWSLVAARRSHVAVPLPSPEDGAPLGAVADGVRRRRGAGGGRLLPVPRRG